MNRLADKVAVITGADSRTGSQAARVFADEGAKVVLCSGSQDKLDPLVREIEEAGGEALAVSCDLSSPEDVRHLAEAALQEFGQIDILVNNAGLFEPSGASSPKDLKNSLNENESLDAALKGTLYAVREILKEMKESGKGSIVNITSAISAPEAGQDESLDSQKGILGLTRYVASRFAGTEIRCNAVCTGSRNSKIQKEEDLWDQDLKQTVLHHLDIFDGQPNPEDLADLVLFLASDESRALTGQILMSDFGASL